MQFQEGLPSDRSPSKIAELVSQSLVARLNALSVTDAMKTCVFGLSVREMSSMAYFTDVRKLFGEDSSTSEALRNAGFFATNVNILDVKRLREYETKALMKNITKVVSAYASEAQKLSLACPSAFKLFLEGQGKAGNRRGHEDGKIQAPSVVAYCGHLAKLVAFLIYNNRLTLSFDESELDSDMDSLHKALLIFSTDQNALLAEDFVRKSICEITETGFVVSAGVDYLGHMSSAVIWGFKLVWGMAHYIVDACSEALRTTHPNFYQAPTGKDAMSVSIQFILSGEFNKCATVLTFLGTRAFSTSHIGTGAVHDIFQVNHRKLAEGNFAGEVGGQQFSCKSTGFLFRRTVEYIESLSMDVFGGIPSFEDILHQKITIVGMEGTNGDALSFWYKDKEGLLVRSMDLNKTLTSHFASLNDSAKKAVVSDFNELCAMLVMSLGLIGPRREAELGEVDFVGSEKGIYIYPSILTKDMLPYMLIFRKKNKHNLSKLGKWS